VYEKLLDLLERRARTRETSTLTIATVASSASLILLGVFFNIPIDDQYHRWLLGIMGFVFPLIGLAYREVTYYTIQEHDFNETKKIMVEKFGMKEAKYNEIVKYQKGSWIRGILFRSLVILPVLFWIFIASPSNVFVSIIITFSLIVGFGLLAKCRNSHDSKREKESL